MPTPQRISLIEAYDNRDVIAWLVRHTEEIKDLQDLVATLPESDKFVLTIGDQTINGTKSFVNKIVAAGGIEADTLVRINADLQVYGDIYQNGSAYDTHAEQLYSTKDYIIMREGAVTALSPGTMSGLEITKYDGTNNLRLAVDSSGTARIGDVGDEQPFLTRDEAADLVDGAPLVWDATDNKAVSGTIEAVKKVKVEDGSLVAPDASGNMRMIVYGDGKTAPASDGLGGIEIEIPTYKINSQNFTSLTELSKNFDIVGGAGISVTASLGQVTIAATGGSGTWQIRADNYDWSDLFENNNNQSLTAKKDILFIFNHSSSSETESGITFIPKGYFRAGSVVLNVSGARLTSNSLRILSFAKLLPTQLSSGPGISGESQSVTFTTDGSTVTLAMSNVNESFSKSYFTIWTRE